MRDCPSGALENESEMSASDYEVSKIEKDAPCHIRKSRIMQIRKHAYRSCLLSVVDHHRVLSRDRKQHSIRQREHRVCRSSGRALTENRRG